MNGFTWDDENLSLEIAQMNTVIGIRPAISLKSGTNYSAGIGTESDPYIVTL